jgi:hypothetical protein
VRLQVVIRRAEAAPGLSKGISATPEVFDIRRGHERTGE